MHNFTAMMTFLLLLVWLPLQGCMSCTMASVSSMDESDSEQASDLPPEAQAANQWFHHCLTAY